MDADLTLGNTQPSFSLFRSVTILHNSPWPPPHDTSSINSRAPEFLYRRSEEVLGIL
jgi:hypothetical protein